MLSPKKHRNMRTAVARRCMHKLKEMTVGDFWQAKLGSFVLVRPLVSELLVVRQDALS